MFQETFLAAKEADCVQSKSNLCKFFPGTGSKCWVAPRGRESSPLKLCWERPSTLRTCGGKACVLCHFLSGPTRWFSKSRNRNLLPLQYPEPGFKWSNTVLTTLKSHEGEKGKYQSKSCLEKRTNPGSTILCFLTSGRPQLQSQDLLPSPIKRFILSHNPHLFLL